MGSQSGSYEDGQELLRVLQTRKETRAFYDKISRVYDLLAERSEEPVRAAALQKLGPKSEEKILEVGFGTGRCLVPLATAVGDTGRVVGIDLSEGMLKMARRNLRRKQMSSRVQLTCGDATRMPFRAAVMDAVFMSFTLELFDTPEIPEVLAECRRILRPEGRIVVASMSKEGPANALVHAFEWTHRHFPNFLDCRPIFARRALETSGFRIVSSEQLTMWIPVEIVLAKAV